MMCKTISLALAAVLALGPPVHAGKGGGSSKVKSMYFSEVMAEGEEVQLLYHGPFTISAACSDTEVRLLMMVEAEEEEEWVYGFPDYLQGEFYNSCVGTRPAETTSDACIVWSTGSGKSDIAGAYASLSGYYVGFGGPSTIGVNKAYLANDLTYHDGFTTDDLDKFPTSCAISGEITYNKV